MVTIEINGKKKEVSETVSFRTLLEGEGMHFPCKGAGKCGKCRVVCQGLHPTALDERFLNEHQLKEGVRLACDKTLSDGIQVSFAKREEETPVIKLSECSIAVLIDTQMIHISILNDGIVETVTLENPTTSAGLFSLASRYGADRNGLSKLLRGAIGKECVELFEKYGAAKADTVAIAGSGMFLKMLMAIPLETTGDLQEILGEDTLSLPTESIYLLPVLSNLVGGDILATLVTLPDECLYLDAGDIFTVASIQKEDTLLSTMYGMEYTETELKGVKAAVQFFLHGCDRLPPIYLSGNYRDKVTPVLHALDVSHFYRKKDMEPIASACLNNRIRAKLRKEQTRSTVISLGDSELFQSYFTKA